MNPTRNILPCILMCIGLLHMAGCATPNLTARTPKVTFVGTETIQEFANESFLECVEPEAMEMRDRKLQRSSMDRPLYYNDKANRDHPASLHVPARYTVTLESFQELVRQGAQGPPRLMLQARERQKVLRAKVYQLQTSMYDDKGEFVRSRAEVEKFPRYYDWNWYPACKIRPECRIEFTVRELEGVPGACHRGSGRLNANGAMYFDLQPYIEWGLRQATGLSFVFACPDEGLHAEVHVPREVFEACRGGSAP
jgi:hypothetical protein